MIPELLTNRTDLTAAQIAYRMAARWRQENYFKYAREHFALDALDSYADHPDDPTRLVPNPAKAHAIDQVASARASLIGAQADMADALDTAVIKAGRRDNGGKATVDPAAGQALNTAQIDLAAAKKVSRNIASHLPPGQGIRVLRPATATNFAVDRGSGVNPAALSGIDAVSPLPSSKPVPSMLYRW